jgi:protein gp37
LDDVLNELECTAREVVPLVLTKRPERIRLAIGDYTPTSRIWCGVTIGCASSRWRLAELQRTPCAGRWLSLEPLLEPLPGLDLSGIGFVVVGCESGPGARDCLQVWQEDIVRQCQIARVPVFVKQVRVGKRVSRNMDEWPAALRIRERPGEWR